MEQTVPAILTHAPKKTAKKYAKMAARAGRSPTSAIKLKCIECCGWERKTAVACDITTCALYEVSSRLFRRGTPSPV